MPSNKKSLQQTSATAPGNSHLATDDGDGDDQPDFGDDDDDFGDMHDGFEDDADDMVMEIEAEMPANDLPDLKAADIGGTANRLTYEDLVRQHIDNYVAEAQRYAVQTDLSRRLQDWEERIKPLLVTESERAEYDIHAYGESVIEKMPDAKGKQGIRVFEDVANTNDAFEVCRIFLATLQLANNGNIEIKQNGKEGDVCVRSMNLKLLSRIPRDIRNELHT